MRAAAASLFALIGALIGLTAPAPPALWAQRGREGLEVARPTDGARWTIHLPALALNAQLDRGVRTVILTDQATVARLFDLGPESAELATWRQRLATLAARPEVSGALVLDLAADTDANVATAYTAWTANTDPTTSNRKANAVAVALRDWLWRQRDADWPGLRYVVIAGDDRVVPFFRLRIDPPAGSSEGWATEAQYFDDDTVAAGSTVGAALAANLTLNDDHYGARQPTPWTDGAASLPIPTLAVGRLVERPSQMVAAIDAFLDRPRLNVQRTLLAGYDFMQDGLEALEPSLGLVLPPSARTRLIGPDWRDTELSAALFGGRPDLFYFALHATHYFAETPNNGILLAQTIAGSEADLSGMLVVGLACHAGLNVPGPKHPRPMDFPEAWLGHGATFVASPGWAFGGDRQTPELRWQERLMFGFTELLVAEDGIAVGDALVRAKREYLAGLGEHTAWHAKTLGGTVLYGLPMLRVQVGAGPEAQLADR
jgi:hypothetical protein